jgi:hypothetical protein
MKELEALIGKTIVGAPRVVISDDPDAPIISAYELIDFLNFIRTYENRSYVENVSIPEGHIALTMFDYYFGGK